LLELEKQVTMLSSSPQDMPPDDVLGALTQQVEDVRKVMQQDAGEIPSLELKQQKVQASLSEVEAHASQLEIEVAREQKRCEAEKELLGQSPEEQKNDPRGTGAEVAITSRDAGSSDWAGTGGG